VLREVFRCQPGDLGVLLVQEDDAWGDEDDDAWPLPGG
jgi:predicted NUDIX family NTP pyrophosphohydrolase